MIIKREWRPRANELWSSGKATDVRLKKTLTHSSSNSRSSEAWSGVFPRLTCSFEFSLTVAFIFPGQWEKRICIGRKWDSRTCQDHKNVWCWWKLKNNWISSFFCLERSPWASVSVSLLPFRSPLKCHLLREVFPPSPPHPFHNLQVSIKNFHDYQSKK